MLSAEELITCVSDTLVDDYGLVSSFDKACSIFFLLRGVVGGGISKESDADLSAILPL